MKIEEQVASVEPAKELKELGLKQDSWISWIYYSHESLYGMSKEELSRDIEFEWGLDCELCHNVDYIEKYAAPTVAELGEMLPGKISEKIGNMVANPYFLDCRKIDSEHSYYVRYIRHATGDTFCIMRGNKEADIRAKMRIYLIKEGIVKVEDKR